MTSHDLANAQYKYTDTFGSDLVPIHLRGTRFKTMAGQAVKLLGGFFLSGLIVFEGQVNKFRSARYAVP